MPGDCYEANARFLRDQVEPDELADWQLCHGTLINAAGVAIDHCWLESRGSAYDFSNGNAFELDAVEYRKLTQARDVVAYTGEEVAVNIVRHGHYGPWR